ncbi:MAG: ABC transporter ATP-binding protein [Ardenticatenaceae bacterium]|nr:ABC transporter ATP-binding protein [Ardenticatenaceae bacterium]
MIEANNLGKVFEEFTAVYNLSLNVPSGQLLALLGPNGAGKTTTVRMLGAILRPTSGSARINGYDVVREADMVRHDIGMLTEQPGLYLRMSGLEYLLFYGRLYGLSDDAIKKRGLEMFDRFDMEGQADRRLGQYSKGMRQKVGLIRAMLHNPAVLLLDEPTSAMDPHSAKLVRDAIRELRDDKRTIILCTHNLAEAEALADSIAIIKKGTIVEQGSTAVLKQKLLGQPQLEIRVDRPLNGEISEIAQLVTIESVQGDTIRYRTENPDVTNPQLVRCLGGLGLGVVSLQPLSQSLEQVYLRVVSAEKEEAAHHDRTFAADASQ